VERVPAPDQPPTRDEALERALHLVEQAEAALRARDAEIERLRQLCERLLEHGTVAAVVDQRRRIRGWSAHAERLWALPSERAVGQPVTSVLGVDHHTLGEVQRVPVPHGHVEVVVEPLDDDGDDLVVRLVP
jgi:nitrogen fixation/metabolism regulation signal transduction histidine kinase